MMDENMNESQSKRLFSKGTLKVLVSKRLLEFYHGVVMWKKYIFCPFQNKSPRFFWDQEEYCFATYLFIGRHPAEYGQ
jgi:hypothetical protein